jgi:hypothetical protein
MRLPLLFKLLRKHWRAWREGHCWFREIFINAFTHWNLYRKWAKHIPDDELV